MTAWKPLDPSLVGVGRLCGQMRPDMGDGHGELRCDNCAATWTGVVDEPCPYCLPHATDDGIEAPAQLADRIRSKLLTTAQLRDLPPPEPLLDHLLNLDSLAMMYGASGAGKSFVAIDMAMTIGSHRHWWHSHAVTNGPVVYVAAEGSPGASARATAWETQHGASEGVVWLPEAVNLFSVEWATALADVVAEMQPVLVVIDTFARSIVGADENSTRDVGVAIEHLDKIRRAAGSCVLIVHHAGKDASKGARGASALKAAMDTEIEVGGTENRIVVRNTKQKDGPEDLPLYFRLVGVPGTDSVVLDAAGKGSDADRLPESAFDTLSVLREIDMPDGVPSTTWKAVVEVADRTFFRHQAGLLAHGHIVNIGTEARPRYRPADVVEGGGSDE